jgi:hypothetical protein
VLLQ